ncbi:GEVED domain-containing protein [Hymenobacter aquaticus]|nr:GEVED domain-containing protein [Hymenobacter aquaticus]
MPVAAHWSWLLLLPLLWTLTSPAAWAQTCALASTCQPGAAPVANQAFGMGIFRVQLAGLDTTTAGGTDGYQNYACRARAAQLVRGTTYTLAVQTNPNAAETLRAWIDFDGNGVLSDAELVLASTATGQHTGSFTVPATALTTTPLRLRLAADYVNSPVPTACSTPRYSQTEDYRVLVPGSVTAPRPQARFTAPDTVTCAGSIAFRDQSSNTPTSWLWTFGDGTTSTQQHPAHSYAQAGTYTVKLRACNAQGCDSLTRPAYISVRTDGPRAASCQPATSVYCCGFGLTRVQLATIDQRSADGAAGYQDFSCQQRATLSADRSYPLQLTTAALAHDVRVYLDLNDNGQFDLPGELLYQSIGVQSPAISLPVTATSGTIYNRPLRLRIWADVAGAAAFGPCVAPQRGQVEDYSVTLLPNTAAPVARFALTYPRLCGPLQAALTNQTTGGATSYHWDFGDGTTSTAANPPAHAYSTGGVYPVQLIARNALGADTATQTVVVAVRCPTYCTAAGTGGSASVPSYFTRVQVGSLDNATSRQPGTAYRDFTALTVDLQQDQRYTLRTQTLPWAYGTGPWVRVAAWIDYNQDGYMAHDEQLGDVTMNSPQLLSFRVPANALPGPTRLRVLQTRLTDYASPYDSCPAAFNSAGTEDYTVIIQPAAQAPVAGFRSDLTTMCSGTVQLQDTSRYAPAAWRWSFGDGTFSTLQNPQHTYAAPGTYAVSLQVTNRYGSSTALRPAYLTVTGLDQGPRPASCLPIGGPDIEPGFWIKSSIEFGSSWQYSNPQRLAPYVDATCTTPPIRLTAGVPTSFAMRTPPSTSKAFMWLQIWLDSNDDGVLDPQTERLYHDGNNTLWSGTITPPISAVRGRPLRLRMAWMGAQAVYYNGADPRPCFREEYAGQARDFTVIVSTVTPTTAAAPAAPAWQVYPNPSAGQILIEGAANRTLEVRDTMGRLVREQFLTGQAPSPLDLTYLPKGVYILRLRGAGGTRKVLLY